LIYLPQRRGSIEIIYSMIKLCLQENGILKTHMMYKANLSFAQLNKNIDLLKKMGWIEESEEKNNFYLPTERGKKAAKAYDAFLDQIPKEFLHLFLGQETFSKIYYPRDKE
jgi:predicted transcriptional regulator